MTGTNSRKVRVGVVVSDKMDKSIVVSVQRNFVHSKYGRIVRRNQKYVAHDAQNECKVGDTVKIIETRPLSRTKCWRLGEIIERAK